MSVAHVGLVQHDPYECKVKGFHAVFSIEMNVSKEALAKGAIDKRQEKLKNGRWTNMRLENAMNVVIDVGMKFKIATRAFGVPITLLRDHLYRTTTTRQRGNKSTLKLDEEQKLVDYVFKMQDLGHPLTPAELCLKVALATQYRQMPCSAIGVPENGWLRRFRLRHSEIATRKS